MTPVVPRLSELLGTKVGLRISLVLSVDLQRACAECVVYAYRCSKQMTASVKRSRKRPKPCKTERYAALLSVVALVSKTEVALFKASHEMSSRRSYSLKTSVSTRRRQRMTPVLLRRYLDLFDYTRRTVPGRFKIACSVGPLKKGQSILPQASL